MTNRQLSISVGAGILVLAILVIGFRDEGPDPAATADATAEAQAGDAGSGESAADADEEQTAETGGAAEGGDAPAEEAAAQEAQQTPSDQSSSESESAGSAEAEGESGSGSNDQRSGAESDTGGAEQQAQSDGSGQSQADAQGTGQQQAQPAESQQQTQSESAGADQQQQSEAAGSADGDQSATATDDSQPGAEGGASAGSEGTAGGGGSDAGGSAQQNTDAQAGEQSSGTGQGSAKQLSIGQGGKVGDDTRVFVSRIDAEAQRALISVNGMPRAWIDARTPVAVADTGCRIVLDGLQQRSIAVSEDCPASASGENGSGSGQDGLRPGQTAKLGDGAIRAFVSRLDPEAGRVSVAVNGAERLWLSKGQAAEVPETDCLLSLDGISEAGARLSASCGEGGQASGQSGGVAAGETVGLGDGKLRVFVSKIDGKTDRARVAVNGFETRWATLDRPLRIRGTGCRLLLEGIDGRRAVLSANCSERQPAEGEETATLSPGQAALFAQNTVRVFLSRIDPQAEAVRIAVNGIEPVELTMDEAIDPDNAGCRFELLGIKENEATLAALCTTEDQQQSAAGDDAG